MPEKYLYKDKVLQRKEVEDAAKQSGMDIDTYSKKAGLQRVNDNYNYNGKTISAEDVFDAAKQSGIGFDDYLQKAKITALPDEKKKFASVDLEGSSLEAGNALSQSNGEDGSQIPTIEMYTTPSGEMVDANPIALSKKFSELSNKKIEVSQIGGSSFGMGTTSTSINDEQAQKDAKKLKEDFPNLDFEGINNELKGVPDDVLSNVGKELMQDREQNNPLYQRKLANIKWRNDFEHQILDDVDKGNIDPENYNRLKHSIDTLPQITSQGDFTNQRGAIKSLAQDIQLYGGKNKEEILKNFAVEVSKVYGNPDNKPADLFKDTPEGKYLDNDEQLALQYLKDVDPSKAEQYNRLMIDPKTLKDNPDALKGYNHLKQTLAETSIALQENSVNEEYNSLKKQAVENGGLSEEQKNRAEFLENKIIELNQKKDELDKKYPERIDNKVDNAVREILGNQKLNFAEYAIGKTLEAGKNTVQGAWELASKPFISDASNTIRELAIIGDKESTDRFFSTLDKNKALQTDQLFFDKDLQVQIDAIKNNKVTSPAQKSKELTELLKNNTDKFGRVPIKGGKFNVNPASILYGVTDIGTTLIPFMAIEAATGGIGGAGTAAKFLRTFNAAAVTSFHDQYAQALQNGKGESEAFKEALGTTAITSFAMAGAGTPDAIRAMAGTKTSAAKIIQGMSDDAIEAIIKKGTPKGMKAIGQAIKERATAMPEQFGKGIEGGAKFEAAMAAGEKLKQSIYGGESNPDQEFKRAILGVLNFGLLGVGLGQANYKSPTQMQKGAFLEAGKSPESYLSVAEEMRKDGQLNETEFEQRKAWIEKAAEAYKTLPKSLSEKGKADYMFQTVIKNDAKSGVKDLPPKQAAEAEKTALVADHTRGLILEVPTDKQLDDRKGILERKLEPKKDAEGKVIEIPEKEKLDMQAELEAINNTIENKKSEVDTKLSEVVDLSKVADQVKNPVYKEIFKEGTKEDINDVLKEISDQWHDKESRSQIEKEYPKEIIDAAKEKYPQESNEGLADKLPTVPAPPTEQQSGKDVVVDKPLTKEAEDLIASVGEGSMPTFITKNLEKIAADNGIEITGKMTASDVVNALKEKQQSLSTKPEIAAEVKEGFTEAKDLNKIYADLKAKYGDKKGAAIYEAANRLVNPNKNTIVEIRGNGVVVKEGEKYILKPFGNTDANSKKWTLYKGLDVTDQFVKPSETTTKPEIKNEEAQAPKIPDTKEKTNIADEGTGQAGKEAGGGKEPPKGEDVENNGGEDWTHINKKDITDAEDLASKHPFGESESWKNSVKKGLEKLAKVAKKGESLYDAAKKQVNDWAAKIKQEITDDGKSTFNPNDEQIAQMAYHRAMTHQKRAELEPDLSSPVEAIRQAAEIVYDDLGAQIEMVDYVLHNTATTAGRSFNIRQMISKVDGNNGLKIKRMDIMRKQKGQPLSEKQEQEIRNIHDEEVKNQKAKDEYAQKKAEKDFEEAVKLEVDRRMKAKKDKSASDKTSKPPTEKRAKIADKLNEWADKFEKFGRADLPDGTVKSSLGPDVQKMVSNAMRFVAEGVRDGKNIPEILKDAVKKFGENILDHIKGGLRENGFTDREIEGDRQYALNEIKKLAEKEKSDMLTKSAVGKGLVRELVNSHIDNGLTGKDVFTELNKDLKEIFPEITEQQVRDAYLKEGEFTLDKKENINKAKVDAKNELRSIAKNETDIADLKAERDLRKREREERQKTEYENKLIAEKKGLVDKKALTEKQEARLVELNKELDRIKQRKEKDVKVSNPKDLNRSDKEKAVLDEIKKEKEQWAKEKQAQRDLEVAAKKAQTAAKNEADRLKALTEKRDRLQKGQRDAPSTSTPKVESPAIEQVKAEIKEADKKLREAESEANRINKEMQAKKDKLAEHEANIKRAENGLESIKTNRKKSDRQIDTDIADAETRLKKELNKQGLKLEKGSKAEKEQKQKVADKHNERVDKVIEGIDKKLEDATLTANEKAALENAKKILEKSKVNPDSALDVFDAVDKAEKNTELARAELANSDKLADVKREIANSQIQMGRDKLQTEQDILLQRHKDSLQKKIDENERKIEAGEFVEKEPARLKTSDAESVRLEIKDRETKNKFNALGKKAQREAMTKREKVIDTLQSLYVIGLVGRLSTLAKVGVSAITKQPLNTITSQTFGRLGGVLFPKIENALRGEGNEGWRKEKNRYMAHYGALGKEGMAKLISKGKENAQKADEAYINAKGKLEDIANQHGKDSKQYKDFEKGEFKKAEDKQKQALLDNVTNSLYEWIGGNSWADAAEVFLHSSAKLEQLLGKGEREMWSDKTRKEKIMFVLSTSAATHGVLKNFSARAEFAASFVARLENKMKQGIDISKADEILKTVNESYIAFQRGKYQEDNAITGGFKAGLDGLRIWAEKHPDYKYAADIMAGALKFKNPIVRTPLNIAREAIVEYTIGVPLAIAKYRNSLKDAKVDAKSFDLAGQEMKDHMKNFMDNIPADKADFIYRAFRKGGFGLGVMAITAMGGINFGGFFNRDEKRRKKGDELGINEVEIGGKKLSHLQAKIFEHTSAFFPALLWSNYDRVRDENLKAGHGEIGANLDAVMKDFQGMMDQIPIGNEVQNPLSGIQVPLIGPFLTEYAEASDVDANGEQIKRSPKGNLLERLWQNAEMKIPGLRQNVPIRGKSKDYKDYTKDNKEITSKDIQDFEQAKEAIIDKNIESLKKNGIGDTKYKDLSPDEITKEETYIKTAADAAVKSQMFQEKIPSTEEQIKEMKRDMSRDKNYDFTVPKKQQ